MPPFLFVRARMLPVLENVEFIADWPAESA
jgi:hypothetical protein